MAKNSITDYDNIAANNTDIQSVDIDEGCAPSGINNAIRELMADLADVNDGTVPLASPDINGGTIDGVTIGGTTAGAGTFTAFTSNGIDDNASSTAVTLDSSGRVGIGTTDPSLNTSTYYDDLVIKNDTSGSGAGITIQSNSTNGFGAVDFRKADGSQIGKIYASSGGGQLAFETGGNERLRIDSSGNVGIGTVSPDAKLNIEQSGIGNFDSIILSRTTGNVGDVQSIVWRQNDLSNLKAASISGEVTGASAGALVFNTATGGTLTERLRIDSSGNVGIGTTSPSSYEASANNLVVADPDGVAGITIVGSSAGASAIHFADGVSGSESYRGYIAYSHNGDYMRFASAATECMRIDSSGYLSVPQAYAGTTGGAANVHILSNGTFLRSVSSAKYKTGIEDVEMPYAEELYNLRPVYYKSLGTLDNPDHSHWGFIAEEVAEIDPRLCFYKTKEISYEDDGELIETPLDEPIVEGVQYDRMIPLLLKLLKDQRDKIETLETKVAALENA